MARKMKKFDEGRFDKYIEKKIENYEEERKSSSFPQFYPSKAAIRRMGGVFEETY